MRASTREAFLAAVDQAKEGHLVLVFALHEQVASDERDLEIERLATIAAGVPGGLDGWRVGLLSYCVLSAAPVSALFAWSSKAIRGTPHARVAFAALGSSGRKSVDRLELGAAEYARAVPSTRLSTLDPITDLVSSWKALLRSS